jgi:2-iminobutanoate/2-iminopropanoate deaminase
MSVLPLSTSRSANGFLFVSGQLAFRAGILTGSDITAQTEIVIDNIEAVLAQSGCKLADVVKASIWLTSADDFARFNAVYASRFAEPYPARSTVISALAIPGALVEIDVIADMIGSS